MEEEEQKYEAIQIIMVMMVHLSEYLFTDNAIDLFTNYAVDSKGIRYIRDIREMCCGNCVVGFRLIYLLMETIDYQMMKEKKDHEAIKIGWMMMVNLIKYLLPDNAFDPNNTHKMCCGNLAQQFLLSKYRKNPFDSSVEVEETIFLSLSRIVRLFVTAGYNVEHKNNKGETAYDIIKADKKLAEFLLPALGKKVDRLDSLAANAIRSDWVSSLGKDIDYPTVLIETIKRNFVFLINKLLL
jgi:hypothetical protein